MESTPTSYRGQVSSSGEAGKLSQEESKWSQGLHAIQQSAKDAAEASEDFVKSHPFYTVLGAATVGFVAGILINRNKH